MRQWDLFIKIWNCGEKGEREEGEVWVVDEHEHHGQRY